MCIRDSGNAGSLRRDGNKTRQAKREENNHQCQQGKLLPNIAHQDVPMFTVSNAATFIDAHLDEIRKKACVKFAEKKSGFTDRRLWTGRLDHGWGKPFK